MALTDIFVKNVKLVKPKGDKYTDGDGMYLHVLPSGKYWRMDYRYLGKRKTIALGVYPATTLAKARLKRADVREQLADGVDPALAKREERDAQLIAATNTFELVARDWLAKTASERAATTQLKISRWLDKNLIPQIGNMPISAIKPRDVLLTVQKMQTRGAIESAHRVKQVCGQIFRFAVATGLTERDVTADLRGALATPVTTHYAAITEPKQVAVLLRAIWTYQGHPYATAALRVSPYLFQRPGEIRSMEWTEIDFDTAEWRIPGQKMKMKNDHVVPLPTQVVEILRMMHPLTGHGRFVYPSIRTGERCMSENTINAALRSLGYSKEMMTAHGFRAMARTILDEVLEERVDLIEHQLAHAVKDPNGRAYNRTAHLPARREMMQRWANYLDELRANSPQITDKKEKF